MTGRRFPPWLYPGMHIKRWLGTLLIGLTILAIGAAILVIELYRQAIVQFPEIAAFLGAELEREIRAAIVITVGVGAHRVRAVEAHAQRRLTVRHAR